MLKNPTARYNIENDTTTVSMPRAHVPSDGRLTFVSAVIDSEGMVTFCEARNCSDMDVSSVDFYHRIVRPSLLTIQPRRNPSSPEPRPLGPSPDAAVSLDHDGSVPAQVAVDTGAGSGTT